MRDAIRSFAPVFPLLFIHCLPREDSLPFLGSLYACIHSFLLAHSVQIECIFFPSFFFSFCMSLLMEKMISPCPPLPRFALVSFIAIERERVRENGRTSSRRKREGKLMKHACNISCMFFFLLPFPENGSRLIRLRKKEKRK